MNINGLIIGFILAGIGTVGCTDTSNKIDEHHTSAGELKVKNQFVVKNKHLSWHQNKYKSLSVKVDKNGLDEATGTLQNIHTGWPIIYYANKTTVYQFLNINMHDFETIVDIIPPECVELTEGKIISVKCIFIDEGINIGLGDPVIKGNANFNDN